MKRWLVALALAACAHQKDDVKDEAKEDVKEEAKPAEEAPREKPKEGPPRDPQPPRSRNASQPDDVRPAAEAGRPELAMSPEGLMLEDGPRLIQRALADRGYLAADHQTGTLDAETSAALRKFQADQKLARTGAPDRETVRKLGVALSKVFKKATREDE